MVTGYQWHVTFRDGTMLTKHGLPDFNPRDEFGKNETVTSIQFECAERPTIAVKSIPGGRMYYGSQVIREPRDPNKMVPGVTPVSFEDVWSFLVATEVDDVGTRLLVNLRSNRITMEHYRVC